MRQHVLSVQLDFTLLLCVLLKLSDESVLDFPPCMCVCSCSPQAFLRASLCRRDHLVCFVHAHVSPAVQRAHLNMCRMVAGRKPLIWQTCVVCLHLGSAVSHLCVCVCERVCVWCGQRLKRASVHMGTNDRICFSEPVCEKKQKDERTRASKNQRRGLSRPPTEISLQRQMVSPRSPVLTRHPPQ